MSFAETPSKLRILVVEDSYLTAEAVCDMVVSCGWDVAGAVGRVESGVKFLHEHAIDGAVVDIDLHGTLSFPLCEQLRKRDIPFVFLSGCDRNYPVPEEFRATPWLVKPVDNRQFALALAGLARSAVPDSGRGNLILDRLSVDDWRALRLRLEQVSLEAGEVLWRGDEVDAVYFPTGALVSVTARTPHGKVIEVAIVGRDGMAGYEVALGKTSALGVDAVVYSGGPAWRISAAELLDLGRSHPSLREVLLGAAHAFVHELAGNAAAIGTGTIEQRLARRLLQTSALLGSRRFAMTHESLAKLMAVRRSGVTVALHMLEGRRLIRSQRKFVEILDYKGLVQVADGGPVGPGRSEGEALPSR